MMFRFLLVMQTGPSRPKLSRLCTILGLAVVLVPSLGHAQGIPDPGATLPFKDILFVERGIIGGSEENGFHFCDEYFGHNGKTGGGLFLLKNFQSAKPEKVDIVAGLKVPSGSVNAGQTLSSGTFLSPDLSYDGKTVVFAWSSGERTKWTAKNRFHIFKVDIDGKNLFQVTDGDFDDMHTAWMPNGRIVFISTRRGGYGRCHGRSVPTYTLHSVKSDGNDLIRLSEHETNEFHPSIANDGRIVYMRWDYIDRDALAAHHIWFCNPDGSNPRSWGGNYSLPLDTFSGGPWLPPVDGRLDGRKNGKRPQSEFYPRAIPGSATKFIAVAGPHHGEAYGTLIIRDFSKVDDNEMGQVTKITPDVGMPETSDPGGGLVYGPTWPLSETLFLTSHNNSIVLVDISVKPYKRTELYKSGGMRPIYPMPVAVRTPPPVIAPGTYQGERWYPEAPPPTVQVNDVRVTDSYGKLPEGAKIKSMRIVQVLSKSTPSANNPRLGYSSQNVAKMVLGTVPVEADGSVFFEGPIGKLILFQLLDENGMAVQTMRSATYLHPGENMACVGCHEDKMSAPPAAGTPIASKRAASKMVPELGRVEPNNYNRVVGPVLAKKCYPCHKEKGAGPTDSSYGSQGAYAWWFAGDANGNLEAVHGGSRSRAGLIGALGSRMGKALLNATHKKALADGTYTATDMLTVTQWLDIGSDELGAFEDADRQRKGELVWPSLDVDKDDPQGLKYKPENKNYGIGRDGGTSTIVDARQPNSSGGAGPGTTSATGGGAGNAGGDGSGGSRGGGGTNGAGTRSRVASGGQNGSGSQTSKAEDSPSGSACSIGAKPSAPAHVWILFVIGLALLARSRRGARYSTGCAVDSGASLAESESPKK